MLYSDPNELFDKCENGCEPDIGILDWEENNRGVSYQYGPRPINKFLTKNGIDLIVRSKEPCVEVGYMVRSVKKLLL